MNDTVARVEESLFRRELDMRDATLHTAYRRLEAAGCIRSCWDDERTGGRGWYDVRIVATPKRRQEKKARRKTKKRMDRLQEG